MLRILRYLLLFSDCVLSVYLIFQTFFLFILVVFLIWVRMDPELISGSRIIIPDPSKIKETIIKKISSNFGPKNSGLCVLYDCSTL